MAKLLLDYDTNLYIEDTVSLLYIVYSAIYYYQLLTLRMVGHHYLRRAEVGL